MDRRLCLQSLTTAAAVAWLPCAAFADAKKQRPTPASVPLSGNEMHVPSGKAFAPDPLYAQAVLIVMTNKRASISLVQRHLRLGYTRAAGLLRSMEQAGLISVNYVNGFR